MQIHNAEKDSGSVVISVQYLQITWSEYIHGDHK